MRYNSNAKATLFNLRPTAQNREMGRSTYPLTLRTVGLANVQELKSFTQMVSRSPQMT